LTSPIVKTFKGITANKALRIFLDLKKTMWKSKLWSPAHYVGTASHVSAQTIERHIREQSRRFMNSTSTMVFSPKNYKK